MSGKLAEVLRLAFEAACEGKQCLIARPGGGSVIIAPAPKFDPSAVDPPLLIAQDARPCACGLGSGDPCPVHQADEWNAARGALVSGALRAAGMCGHVPKDHRAGVCIASMPCEIDHNHDAAPMMLRAYVCHGNVVEQGERCPCCQAPCPL